VASPTMLTLMASLIQRRASVNDPEWYRAAIRARGLTWESFAHRAGISRKTLGDWLSGRRCCHVRTELKVAWALQEIKLAFPSVEEESWRRAMPPHVRDLLGPVAKGDPEREGRRRPPREGDYLAALSTVPPLKAWEDYGYRLVPSGRAGAAFRRDLAEGRPWLAFPEVFKDEADYLAAASMSFRSLWP
jgi:transcriptional regulator with XRE-family HTH domain